MTTTEERFWEKVEKARPDECWEWEAGRDEKGYGRFSVDRVPARAHRVAYELEVGEIPDGLCVLHDCDNPACVNPAHLHLGTQIDNIQEMDERGRRASLRGEDSPRSKLTALEVLAIRAIYSCGTVTQAELGEMFGVTQVTISHIVNRKQWRHV